MRKFIDKILDVPKLIRRIWIILWLLLGILLVMKFCFGIWYPIVIENEWFLKFNDYVQTSWIKYLVLVIFYLISGNFLYLISSSKRKYENITELIIINVLILSSFILKNIMDVYGFIIETIISIVIPIIYFVKSKKCFKMAFRILYPIAVQLLIYLWMANIFLIRDLDTNKINNEYFIIGFILQLDYYIFLIITWIGVSYMGLWSFWIFSKDVTTLKAYREKECNYAN